MTFDSELNCSMLELQEQCAGVEKSPVEGLNWTLAKVELL